MNHDIDRTQVGFAQGAGSYAPHSSGSVFNEDEQMDLAAGLMEVESDQELDNFLGDVISGAANAVGKFISSPTGQALGSGLKDVAKQLLPVAGPAQAARSAERWGRRPRVCLKWNLRSAILRRRTPT